MACINATVTTLSNNLNAHIETISDDITVFQYTYEQAEININNLNPVIQASTTCIGEKLNCTISRIGGITGTVSIICSLSEFIEILKVSPEEVQWITDDVGVFYEVESNIEWIVTID